MGIRAPSVVKYSPEREGPMNAAVRLTARLVPVLTLTFAAAAFAQGPPMPGPEHDVLKRDVGVWDSVMEMSFPGIPPMTMTGVETSTLLAGRWLVTEYRGEVAGMVFEGRGLTGWDPAKKAYVAVWVDSMNTSINQSESTFDAAANTLKGWMEMADPSGTKSRAKTEETWPTPDTRLVKVFGPDGGTEPMMKITYTKRK
jgi:hypothetical protein